MIAIDPQINGARDDGSESGIVRTETLRDGWSLLGFRRGLYTSANIGSGTVASLSGLITNSVTNTGTAIQVSLPASAAYGNGATIGFWIHGNMLGLAYYALNTTVPPGCTIDGINYAVPVSKSGTANPLTLSGVASDELPLVEVANDLGDGPHWVELSFACAASGSTRYYVMQGYAVDRRSGYVQSPAGARTGATIFTLTASYSTLLTGASTNANIRSIRQVIFYNSTGGAITATMKHFTYGVFWSKSVAAGDTVIFDPGTWMYDGTELQAAGNGLTCTVIGGI